MRINKKTLIGIIAVSAAAVGLAVSGGSEALAAHSLTASPDKPVVWGCVNPSTAGLVGGRFYIYKGDSAPAPFNRYPGCATWATRVNWAEGNGAPGDDAAVTEQTSATTGMHGWAESSGWADDDFNRTISVTRQSEVDASKCGVAAQACYFYTGTISDVGTFTTVPGKPAPNGSDAHTITTAFQGSMNGVAKIEFYASSNKADSSLVRESVDGRNSIAAETSNWYILLFPEGTAFGVADSNVGALISYDWEYTTACEQWSDSINPGDDGQGSGDGNITAVCAS